MLISLGVGSIDEAPDLDLPAITPSASGQSSTAKRKIVPTSPIDLDLTLSPAGSLPDLYEFNGRRTSDDFDESALRDIDIDDDLDTPPADRMASSMFGPELDWEGLLTCYIPASLQNSTLYICGKALRLLIYCSAYADSADASVEPIPEYSAREEFEDAKKWRVVTIGDKKYRIDMESIEPYKKVLSHGGLLCCKIL